MSKTILTTDQFLEQEERREQERLAKKRILNQRYYAANKEKLKEKNRAKAIKYYAKNKDVVKKKNNKRYHENKVGE